MAGPINLGGDAAADFAASLAEASSATKAGNNDDQPSAGRPATAGSDGAPADDGGDDEAEEGAASSDVADADEAGADDASEDEESSDDESEDDDSTAADPDEVARELGQLLVDNPKEFFKRTGIDPKVLKLNGPKFQAMRAGLKEVRETKAANDERAKTLDTYKAKVDSILEEGRQKFGPFVDLKNALGLDDFSAAQEILTGLDPKKRDFKTIAAGIVEAARSTSPSELQYKRKLRELAEKERKDAEAAAAAKQSEAIAAEAKALEQKNLQGAAAKLKGTDFDGIPKADETLVRIVAENWDPARNGLKVPWSKVMELMADDPVMKLGLENKALKKGKPAKKAETPAPARGDRTPPPRPKAGAKPDPDAELRATMAEANRLEQASKRRASAGKGRR